MTPIMAPIMTLILTLALTMLARQLQRVKDWEREWQLREWQLQPGEASPPPSPAMRMSLTLLGTPARHRWVLWHRTLGLGAMPTLEAQAIQVRSLLSTPLLGLAALETDVAAAVQSAFFSSDEQVGCVVSHVVGRVVGHLLRLVLGHEMVTSSATLSSSIARAHCKARCCPPRRQGIPVEAAPLIISELTAVLTLLLKRWRLAYRSELPLASMAAPILLVVYRQAAADKLLKEAERALSSARRERLELQIDTLERASGTQATLGPRPLISEPER